MFITRNNFVVVDNIAAAARGGAHLGFCDKSFCYDE